jgi:hypothetical protein
LLNLVLAEFCHHVYTFDTDLALRFTPRKTYGDGKFSFLSAGLSGGQSARRCFICKANIGDTAKGLDFSTEYRDYADMTRTYATALFVVVKTVHANKDFKITKARKLLRLLAGAEGAHNFPWVVSGNTQAKEEIMLLLTSFLWPDCENPQEQLAAERAVVQARLDEMLHLDARLNESPLVVFPKQAAAKYDPSLVSATVCLDHPMKHLARSLYQDFGLRLFPGGKVRSGVSGKLLELCGNKGWFDNFYTYSARTIAAKIVHDDFMEDMKFPIPLRQMSVLLHLICGQSYQKEEYTPLQLGVFKATCALFMPLLQLFLKLHPFVSGPSSTEGNKLVDDSWNLIVRLYPHMIEHFPDAYESYKIPLIFTNEGGLDQWLGRLQGMMRARGGHGKDSLERCLNLLDDQMMSESLWGLNSGKRGDDNKAVLPKMLLRPLLFEARLLEDATFTAAFDRVTAVLEKLDGVSVIKLQQDGLQGKYATLITGSACTITTTRHFIEEKSPLWCFCVCKGIVHQSACPLFNVPAPPAPLPPPNPPPPPPPSRPPPPPPPRNATAQQLLTDLSHK